MRIFFVVDGIRSQNSLKEWAAGIGCADYALMPFSDGQVFRSKKQIENYVGGVAQKLALSRIFESYEHVVMCKKYVPTVPSSNQLERYLIFSMRKKPDCLEFIAFFSVYLEEGQNHQKAIQDALRGFHVDIFS